MTILFSNSNSYNHKQIVISSSNSNRHRTGNNHDIWTTPPWKCAVRNKSNTISCFVSQRFSRGIPHSLIVIELPMIEHTCSFCISSRHFFLGHFNLMSLGAKEPPGRLPLALRLRARHQPRLRAWFACSGMWSFRMWGFKMLVLNPSLISGLGVKSP